MSNYTRYTVTAALPYANGPIHLGHVAGAHLPADIYVRYLREKRLTVVFVSGSDEHGVPVTVRAQQEGITPQQVVDKYHTLNKRALQKLGISYDIFSRTSSPIHHETAAHFFTTLHHKGMLEVIETTQYYDPICQQFLSDRYIKGSCPHCRYPNAYGDQCEACGSTLSPEELIHPISMLSSAKPILKPTKHWHLPLHQYGDWLRKWLLEEDKNFKANVYGQCKSWLAQGLHSRAITRDLNWGIAVPLEEWKEKVLYVWFEAPIGYISATKEWAAERGVDWEPFWKDPHTQLIHFLGKDNIVFHCIIFPVMLKAHGDFILPHQVSANEFLNLEGHKFSTSRDHAVWLQDYLETFPGKEDVLRYVLCSIAPENKDSDFTWKDFQNKHNNELVANLGNLVHRTLTLVHRYYNGSIPPCHTLYPEDQRLLALLTDAFTKVGNAIERFKFKEALQCTMGYATLGNRYLTEQAPWHAIKSNPQRAETILHITLQLIATISLLLKPFLPTVSHKIATMLSLTQTGWDGIAVAQLLQVGRVLPPPFLLFEKIEDDIIENQIQKLM